MTFGMTQQSSYSAAPTAFAMVMPSPVLSALPWYWKPILLMAGTSWSQYSLLPPKPPIASTTARAMMSCFPSGPSTLHAGDGVAFLDQLGGLGGKHDVHAQVLEFGLHLLHEQRASHAGLPPQRRRRA